VAGNDGVHRERAGVAGAGGQRAADLFDPAAHAGDASLDVGDLVFPPIVSLTALSLATVLAVYKPWGRLRRR
jgi:hypothetical protein